MIFWNNFNKKKPTKSGWYLCTVDAANGMTYVMDLYWNAARERFIDNRRLNVFQSYEVYGYGDGTVTDESGMPCLVRLYKDDICDRTEDVLAWRNQPKCWIGRVKGKEE